MTLSLRGKDKQKVQEQLENEKKHAELFDKSEKPTATQKTGKCLQILP
jgi:hypothetical protein